MTGLNHVRAFWYMSNNFGDALNFDLIKYISGKEPVYTDDRTEDHFIVCGSILAESNENSTVWGAGFAAHDQRISGAKEILAVRGTLSRNNIDECLNYIAVGDPALLMRRFYNPVVEKKHKYGIIPHWKDLEIVLSSNIDNDFHIINPLQPTESFIKDVLSCEKILSTGLHGLIIADTYGVPNQWLDLGTDIGGDGFKFADYYSTTDSPNEKPVNELNWDECKIHNYIYSLDDLLNSCPFNTKKHE